MKKILFVIDDYHVSLNALKFAIEIACKQGATLFGLVVGSAKKEEARKHDSADDISLTVDPSSTGQPQDDDNDYSTSINLFGDHCSEANIPFNTHIIRNHFLDSLIDHSAFADVIICNADASFSQYSVTTLIANAHCPVLMVNEDYKQVDNIIFTYDDKSSSIHAVKYFTYLFKFYNHLPVHFMSVLPHNIVGIEYEDLIREWLPLHYSNAKVEIVRGETRKELSNYINNHQNALVIMGAFGRSSLSRFFKESLANSILENTNAPIFITHD